MNDLLKRAEDIRYKFDNETDSLKAAVLCREAMDLLSDIIDRIKEISKSVNYTDMEPGKSYTQLVTFKCEKGMPSFYPEDWEGFDLGDE